MNRIAPLLARIIIGSVFLAAAISKMIEPRQVALTITHVIRFDGDLNDLAPIVGVLVAIELTIGGLLIAWRRPLSARFLYLLGFVLVCFTFVLARLAMDPAAPCCGCISAEWLALRALSARTEASLGIARNLALLWCVAILIRMRSTPVTGDRPEPIAPPRPPTPPPRAFTVTELLITIAVIAILTAVLIPAIGHARRSTQQTVRTSTARQLVGATLLYATDHAQSFPYFGTPGDPEAPIFIHGFRLPFATYFGSHMRLWTSLIITEYYDAWRDPNVDRYLGPDPGYDDPPDTLILSRFLMTACAAAAPQYWIGDLPPNDRTLFRPAHVTEMKSPSAKGLLMHASIESESEYLGPFHVLVAMGDGSAGRKPWLGNTDPDRFVVRYYGAWPRHILTTRGGIAGRDY